MALSQDDLVLKAQTVFDEIKELKKNKDSKFIINKIQQKYKDFFYGFDFIVAHMESLNYFNQKVFINWLKEIEYNPYNKTVEDRVDKQIKYCILAFCDIYKLKKTSNRTKKYKMQLRKELLDNATKQKELLSKVYAIQKESESNEKQRLKEKICCNAGKKML